MKKISCLLAMGICLFLIEGTMPTVGEATSGTCSYHEGVDCKAGSDSDGSVICNDGWRDSSVSYLNSCEEEVSLMRRIDSVATAICAQSYLYGYTNNITTCIEELTLEYYKIYDSSCVEGMLLSNNGNCFCLGYAGGDSCMTDVFMNEVANQYCGRDLSSNEVLSVMSSAIEYGNIAFDMYLNISCDASVDTLSLSQNSTNQSEDTGINSSNQNQENNSSEEYDSELQSRLTGYILLQVEEHGEAWYVNPNDSLRYYMANGDVAYEMMRSFSLGITNADLEKIPAVASSSEMLSAKSVCSTNSLANRLKGYILLQVEEHGEAWYIHPDTCRRIYMKDGDEAYNIMRYLSLGIANADLEKLPSGNIE